MTTATTRRAALQGAAGAALASLLPVPAAGASSSHDGLFANFNAARARADLTGAFA